jgi:hypothetical protein
MPGQAPVTETVVHAMAAAAMIKAALVVLLPSQAVQVLEGATAVLNMMARSTEGACANGDAAVALAQITLKAVLYTLDVR